MPNHHPSLFRSVHHLKTGFNFERQGSIIAAAQRPRPPAPPMVPAAASSASARRRVARRRSLAGDGVHGEEWALGGRIRRADELEAAAARLRAEKEAAERAAAALRAELEKERGAAETATIEAMLMIGRLQREKAAAMIEAREFRRIAEGHAGRDRELQDQLAAVSAVAASYELLLRAHGIEPDDHEGEESHDHHEEREVEEAVDVNAGDDRDAAQAKGVVVVEEPSPSPPPPPPAAEELKYAVAVTKPVARVRVSLCARVDALEADSAAVRREVAALRAEHAQAALAREVARRLLCRDAAAARALVAAGQKQQFSVLAIFKWFLSTIFWGPKRYAPATSKK